MTLDQAREHARKQSRITQSRQYVFKHKQNETYHVASMLMSSSFEGPLHSFRKGREYKGFDEYID